MKNSSIALLAFVLPLAVTAAEPRITPIYEETFNAEHTRSDYRNGAKCGLPGSGVSGKPTDFAYIGAPATSENAPSGPVLTATAPIAPDAMDAFTYTFWYYLDEQCPELQVPFSTAGTMLLLTEKGFELRIEHSLQAPRQYVFTPGINGPLAGWRDTQKWIFASFSWNRSDNTCAVHQGTLRDAIAFMRTMSRHIPADSTFPRTDLTRNPETIGNTYRSYDRPLAGRIDNFRVFDRVLNTQEIEEIRQCDLANEPVRIK